MENYAVSMKRVEEHNRQGTSSYQMGETRFADMTFEEFRSQYLGSDYQTWVQTQARPPWSRPSTCRPRQTAHGLSVGRWTHCHLPSTGEYKVW